MSRMDGGQIGFDRTDLALQRGQAPLEARDDAGRGARRVAPGRASPIAGSIGWTELVLARECPKKPGAEARILTGEIIKAP